MASNNSYGFDTWSVVAHNKSIGTNGFLDAGIVSNAGRVASEISVKLTYDANATEPAVIQISKELGSDTEEIRTENTVGTIWNIPLPVLPGQSVDRVICVPANRVGRFLVRILNPDASGSISECTVRERKIRTAVSEIGSITPEEIGAEPYIIKKTGFNRDFGVTVNTVCEGNDARLSDARTPLDHEHLQSEITDFEHGHDASSITSGVLDIARIPAGALERLVIVANQTERFALTLAAVQVGDTVKQEDTGVMYRVVNSNALHLESGYVPYSAERATAVAWSGVEDKPSSFPAETHDNTKHTENYVPETRQISGASGVSISNPDLTADLIISCNFGAEANTVCVGNDARLSDARTPLSHGNEAHSGTFVLTNDSRLSDARTPTAHKDSHAQGGADYLAPSDIGAANAVHGTHVVYSTVDPLVDGVVSQGVSEKVSREDHVHPTDTSRAASSHTHAAGDVNSGVLDLAQIPTGTTGTTVALGNHNHDTVYALKSEVPDGVQYSTSNPIMNGVAAQGSSDRISREDHVHPTDTSRAASSHTHAVLTAGTGLTGSSYNAGSAQTWSVAYGTAAGTACQGNDSRLSDSRTPISHNNTHHSTNYAAESVTITAGDGLSGGGTLAANSTITLGAPGDCSNSTTSSVTTTSHTHAISGFALTSHSHGASEIGTHTHAAGDVTSGTFAIARIPTGTTSSTVSLGNHTHLGTDITSAVSNATTAANCSRQILNGNGMNFTGGALTTDRTVTLGTPSACNASTSNGVTASSHTHSLGITISTSSPSGGTNGDVWLQY